MKVITFLSNENKFINQQNNDLIKPKAMLITEAFKALKEQKKIFTINK